MARSSASLCNAALASCVLLGTILAPVSSRVAHAAALDLSASAATANLALLQGPGEQAGVEELYLEVYLNSVPAHRILQVVASPDGHLQAWADNLRDCGLLVDVDHTDRYLDLDELDGIRHRYDALNQRLYFDAEPERLNVRTQRLGDTADKAWRASVSPGALLNYDLYASTGEQRALAAGTVLRLFGEYGVIESSGLSRFAEGQDSEPYIRLDTAWTYSLQDELLSLSVGDYISGNLSWTRPTRVGGIQLRRNFALQPGLLTYPLPQFFGEAALPSRIELYVNGVRQYSGETPPGPFQLSTPPNVSGAGSAQVVLTDALGRSRTIDFSFYNANRLLRAGFSDYAFGAGAVRRHYGIESFRYRDDIGADGSYAYGLNDWLTLETHLEGDQHVQMGGGGGIVRIGEFGSARGAYAWSRSKDQAQANTVDTFSGTGRQFAAGYNYTAHGYTFDYSLQQADRDFRDLASAEGRAPNLRSEQALLGSALGYNANVSLSYVRLDSTDSERFRSVGLNASVLLRQSVSLFVSVARDLDGDHDLNTFLGVSTSFGPRLNAGAGYSDNRGARSYDAYVSTPVPADGGSGWQLRARQTEAAEGQETFVQADAGGRGDYGDWSVGLQSNDGTLNTFGTASGSVVLMDAALFPSRRVDNGFALVTTNGVAHVPVLLENRVIGETNSRGHYLLTGLNAYQPNRVAIDPLGLPAQVQSSSDTVTVVPADRAGVRVDYGLRESRSALLVLQDEQGQPVPVGSTVIRDGGPPAVVGFDGQVYLENLSARNRIAVEVPGQSECGLHFDYPAADDAIPLIGPLRCLP